MKKISKVLSVVLAILMLAMTGITAFADHAYLPLDEHIEFYQDGGKYETFNFEAETEGWYVLNTFAYDDSTDPYIYVYDSEGNYVAFGDDSAYGSYDCEVWFYAETDEVYYIEIGNYNYNEVEFSVYFEAENEASHICCWDDDGDAYCDWCGYELCDHNCHKEGVAGFFWNISNFFNRILGLKRYCYCGAFHW